MGQATPPPGDVGAGKSAEVHDHAKSPAHTTTTTQAPPNSTNATNTTTTTAAAATSHLHDKAPGTNNTNANTHAAHPAVESRPTRQHSDHHITTHHANNHLQPLNAQHPKASTREKPTSTTSAAPATSASPPRSIAHATHPIKSTHKENATAPGPAHPVREKSPRREDPSTREDILDKKELELKNREEKICQKEDYLTKWEKALQQRAEELTVKDALGTAAPDRTGKALKAVSGVKPPISRSPAKTLAPLPNKTEREGIMSAAVANLPELTEKQQVEVLNAFNNIDTDGNGILDCSEFFQGLQFLYPDVTKPEANRIYGQIDTNRDGSITLYEFMRAIVRYQWDTSLWRERHRVTTSSENYEWEIPHSELKMIEKLGEGSFGVVYKSKWRNCDIAVKELKAQNVDARLMKAFKQEIAILASLRHPNIVLYMGACTHMPHLSICTEFLSGGSVYQLLHERGDTKLELPMALHLAKQMAVGLCHLHSLHPKIIHRDCKSENLLLDSHFSLKLCDFGLSILEPSDGSNLTERVGSPLWMSPEMLTRSIYTEKTDVYSFGVCLWEMITGEVPFGHITEMGALVDAVARKGVRPKIPTGCPALLVEVVTTCWAAAAASRPSCREVVPKLDRIIDTLKRRP
ncbi:protein kinase [Pelomyxa schiedti]|nr:protein kinase [Pelomyxa schiedti]